MCKAKDKVYVMLSQWRNNSEWCGQKEWGKRIGNSLSKLIRMSWFNWKKELISNEGNGLGCYGHILRKENNDCMKKAHSIKEEKKDKETQDRIKRNQWY